MFMLAATIASTIVFRLLGSENFASGARLKQSEAYQASESGLDATRAWLTNRAADVGALITRYENPTNADGTKKTNPVPVLLTGDGTEGKPNVLGVIGGNREQKFEVYLMGVDTKKYAPTYKLKFLSVGEARDGSKVTQTAIFSVNGLYNVKIPSYGTTIDFDKAFYGTITAGKVTGDATISSAVINGNFVGNQPVTKEAFVVNGTFETQGGSTPSGADFYVKGTSKFNADTKIGKFDANNTTCSVPNSVAYFGGDLICEASEIKICGDAYFNGSIPVKCKIIVYGNATINGTLNRSNDGQQFEVKGNLIFTDNATLNNMGTKEMIVGGNILLPTGTTYNAPTQNGAYQRYLLNGNDNNKLDLMGTIDITSSTWKTTAEAWGLKTGYDKMESYGALIKDDGRIPTPILVKNKDEWMALAQPNATKCDITGYDDSNISKLNACWLTPATKGVTLYGKEGADNSEKFLVVKLSANQNTSTASLLHGNFIFIIDPATGTFRLPPTDETSVVMLYLPNGATGNNGLMANDATQYYNYFIYSEGNISKIIGFEHGKKITGSVIIKDKYSLQDVPTALDLEYKGEVLEALGKAGFIEDNPKYIEGRDRNNSGESIDDPYYIPVASRLAVKLESKEISREIVETDEASDNALRPSILVMPRVVRIAKNEFATQECLGYTAHGCKIQDFYTFMYLNGAERTSSTPDPTGLACNPTIDFENSSIPANLYKCSFATTSYPTSNFYVLVSGENEPQVKITPTTKELTKNESGLYNECATVSLVAPDASTGQYFTVQVTKKLGENWTITPQFALETGSDAANGTYLFKIPAGTTNIFEACPYADGVAEDNVAVGVVFTVEDGEGYDPASSPDNIANITRETKRYPIQRVSAQTSQYQTAEVSGIARLFCPAFLLPENIPVASVTCSSVAASPNGKDKWWCKDGSTVNWTTNINTVAGCKDAIGDASGTLSPIIGTFADIASTPNANTFTADLAWNEYTVTVAGGSVRLSTETAGIPNGDKEQTCNSGDICKVYHGAQYTVALISGGPYKVVPDAGLVYTGVSLTEGGFVLDATSATPVIGQIVPINGGNLTLSPPAAPTLTCEVKRAKMVSTSKFIPKNDVDVIVSGYGCILSDTLFTINGTEEHHSGEQKSLTSTDSPYTISARSNSCGFAEFVECGTVTVTDKTLPEITCNLGGTIAVPKIYTSLSLPKVDVEVKKGEDFLECDPSNIIILGPGDTTFLEPIEPWKWLNTNIVNSIDKIQYAFTKTSGAADGGLYGEKQGSRKSFNLRAVCEGVTIDQHCTGVFLVNESTDEATPTAICNFGSHNIFVDATPPIPLPTKENVTCGTPTNPSITPVVIDKWIIENQAGYETEIIGSVLPPTFPGAGSFLDPNGIQKFYAIISKCGTITLPEVQKVPCGMLTVGNVPSITSCEVTGQTTGTGSVAHTFVLNDPGNVCTTDGSTPKTDGSWDPTWKASIGGGEEQTVIFPLDLGTYTNFKLTGTCGGRMISSNTCAVTNGGSVVVADPEVTFAHTGNIKHNSASNPTKVCLNDDQNNIGTETVSAAGCNVTCTAKDGSGNNKPCTSGSGVGSVPVSNQVANFSFTVTCNGGSYTKTYSFTRQNNCNGTDTWL
ncbi:hypothetical protein AGMMS49938_12250 [Fibrobacterales bacterium]|nr:hypothetical protein AGMMS49938_12250 [Fibrobacterales bacterium]